MTTRNFADLSRQAITRSDAPEPTIDDLKLGTLQRLATAVESLALKHDRPSRLAQAIEALTGKEKTNEINMLRKVNQGLHNSLEEREQSVRKAWHEVHLLQQRIATQEKEAAAKPEAQEVVFDDPSLRDVRTLRAQLKAQSQKTETAWRKVVTLKARIEQYQELESKLRRQINTANDDGYDNACKVISDGLGDLMTALGLDHDQWGDDAAEAAVISGILTQMARQLEPLPVKFDPEENEIALMDLDQMNTFGAFTANAQADALDWVINKSASCMAIRTIQGPALLIGDLQAEMDSFRAEAQRQASLVAGGQANVEEPQHWAATNPGRADQYRAEAKTCRTLLGLDREAENISPVDLRERFDELMAQSKKSAERAIELGVANQKNITDEIALAVNFLRASVGMSPHSPQEGEQYRPTAVIVDTIHRIAADLEALPVWFMSSDQSLHIAPNHPEDQDEEKPQRERGLYKKYHVERMDGAPMPEGCIVLEWSDPSARHGISAYSSAVREDGYTAFANDLDQILRGYWATEGDPRGADAGDAPLIQLGFTNQAQIDSIEQGETGLFFPSMKEGRTIPLYTRSSVNSDHPGASTTAVDDQDKEDQA